MAETLPGALILAGDPTDLDLLELEGVEGVGGFAPLANIGPGLGAAGLVENYGWVDPLSHLVPIGLMNSGRLEIFTVLLLLHLDLWRHRDPTTPWSRNDSSHIPRHIRFAPDGGPECERRCDRA